MSWDISFEVRPADPMDRTLHVNAHEVRMLDGARPIRTVGVWKSKRIATVIAGALNYWAASQIR